MAKDILRENAEILTKIYSVCEVEPSEDPATLRRQVCQAVALIPKIGRLKDLAEQNYRKAKQDVAERCPDHLKSDARKNWIDGEASPFSYQRDRCETMYQGLVLFVSACKSLLMSKNVEMSNLDFDK